MAGGHCFTYAAIVKEGVSVVDLDDDLGVKGMWEVAIEDLAHDLLPLPGSKLLEKARVLFVGHLQPRRIT